MVICGDTKAKSGEKEMITLPIGVFGGCRWIWVLRVRCSSSSMCVQNWFG